MSDDKHTFAALELIADTLVRLNNSFNAFKKDFFADK
jgi:hypothetical protein